MNTDFTKDSIESAYCFFHQKLRVYEYSTSPTQRDDIEYAISQYVDGMTPRSTSCWLMALRIICSTILLSSKICAMPSSCSIA